MQDFHRAVESSKHFLELSHVLVANNLIKFKRNIFKSSSNTFFLASLVYLRWQEILPRFLKANKS